MPPTSCVRDASEWSRQPSNVVRVSESQLFAAPIVFPIFAMVRIMPYEPPCWSISEKSLSNTGIELRLTMPPPALPQAALPFERSTSTRSIVARSIWSNAVRPSGSVSGIPSSRIRTPRDVPAFDRSPAPRAPKPRIVSRMSCVPKRDCVKTPGTACRAWSIPYPERPFHVSAPITDTANGTCVRLRGSRVAVMTTVSSFALESAAGCWAAAGVASASAEAAMRNRERLI